MWGSTRRRGLPSTVVMQARVRVQDLARAALFIEKIGAPQVKARSSLVGIIVGAISSLAQSDIPEPTLEEAWAFLEERWPAKDSRMISREKMEISQKMGEAILGGNPYGGSFREAANQTVSEKMAALKRDTLLVGIKMLEEEKERLGPSFDNQEGLDNLYGELQRLDNPEGSPETALNQRGGLTPEQMANLMRQANGEE